MTPDRPILYVVAGPNGIGKSTSTFTLLPATIPIINSDEIARIRQLSGIAQTNLQEGATGKR